MKYTILTFNDTGYPNSTGYTNWCYQIVIRDVLSISLYFAGRTVSRGTIANVFPNAASTFITVSSLGTAAPLSILAITG